MCFDLLDACLHHPVLARSIAGTRHVAFKYERRLNFVELLKQPLVLGKRKKNKRAKQGETRGEVGEEKVWLCMFLYLIFNHIFIL